MFLPLEETCTLIPKEPRPSLWASKTALPFTSYEVWDVFHNLCLYFLSCEMGNTVPALCLFGEQMSYHV